METTTAKLLDAWKARKGLPSDNQAALKLGITRGAVSLWRNGKGHASAAHAARMARDLGMNELEVLAAVEADRTSGEDRRVWQRYGRASFMVLLLGFTLGLSPSGWADPMLRGQAMESTQTVAPAMTELALMRNIRRRERRWGVTVLPVIR